MHDRERSGTGLRRPSVLGERGEDGQQRERAYEQEERHG